MIELRAKADGALVLAAFDFAGDEAWIDEGWERALGSLALGLAGDVMHQRLANAGLAARSEARPAPGMPVRRRRHEFARQFDGSYILLTGRLHHAAETASRFGIRHWEDHASLYARLYEKLGNDCDRRIVGDYAAVQWFPDQRKVRLVRAPTAQVPMQVWRHGQRMVVCTSPNPIFAFGLVPEVDDARVGGWLLAGAGPATRSFYRGMACVACATSEEHDLHGVRRETYWSIQDVPEVRFRRDEDYVEAVVEQMHRAVEATLEGARTPGLLLSGGFDSQAVAAFAMERLGPGTLLRTYTSIPSPAAQIEDRATSIASEEPHVRALAEMYPQMQPTFVDGAELQFGDRLPQLMMLSGWPAFNEMNAHWYHSALEHAARDGVDLIMTGDAGNMGFSYDGLTGFPTWLANGEWKRLIRELRCYAPDDRPLWRKLISRSVMPHIPQRLKWIFDRHRSWNTSPFDSWCALREEYARSSGMIDEVLDEGFDLYDYDFEHARTWRKTMLDRMYKGGPEISLGYSLLYGLKIRDVHSYVPLLEVCGGMPDDQYLRNGEDRWLGRRVLQDRVPELVWKESRVGRQASDWPFRLARDRDRLMGELLSLAKDERIAALIDFDRLVADLRDWDGREIPERKDSLRLVSAMTRGLATAMFIRYAEGRNG
jgi:asparagine synthase (glutamine-hydrolysing)